MSYSWQGGGFAYCASFVTLLWDMDCAEPPGARGNVARFCQASAKACWLECRPATNRAIFMPMIAGGQPAPPERHAGRRLGSFSACRRQRPTA
jgi:hypothetical protein